MSRTKSDRAGLSGIVKDGKRGNRGTASVVTTSSGTGGGGSSTPPSSSTPSPVQLTGPITGYGTGVIATSITNNAVGDNHLADMPAATVKGRAVGAGTGDPTNLVVAQLMAILATGDGAGSGLDADLLDGQQGAYYLPASSYTAADVLAKLLTVDGAGSGLDADTLDGLSSAAFQLTDADLTAIAALAGTGIAVRTAANTWATRTMVAPAAGLTIANPAGIAGDPTFALADDLAAIEALGSTGIAVRSAANTWVQRQLAAGSAHITIVNHLGVTGNPTIGVDLNQVWSFTNQVEFAGGSLVDSDGDFLAQRGSAPTTGIYRFGNAGTRYLYYDGTKYELPGAALHVNGSPVWTSGNDGAGSTLDADLLDGIDSAAFAQKSVAENITGAWTFDTNVMVVDPTNNRVGFGTASPQRRVHVLGTDGAVASFPTIGGSDHFVLENNTTCNLSIIGGTQAGIRFYKSASAAAEWRIYHDGGTPEALRIAEDGSNIRADWSINRNLGLLLAGSAPNYQSMQGGIYLANMTAAPSANPSAGGFLYVDAGALKWRGSSGTITTMGAA